jgi:tetratricopeptide (TPR) repeat protein
MQNKIVFLLTLFFLSGSSFLFASPLSDRYRSVGNELYQSKDLNKALLYYKAAVQADPQDWIAYQTLGNCEYGLGQRENAVNDFQKSLNLHPNNPGLQSFMTQLAQTGVTPVHESVSLPDTGKWIWDVGIALNSFGWQDLTNAYAPATFSAPTGSPLGIEFDLGVDYTLSHNFQLGFQLQGTIKDDEIITFGNSGVTQTYTETSLGAALSARYLISLGADLNLVLHGEGGIYDLVSSNLNGNNGTLVQTGNLSADNPGGLLEIETEWLEKGGWSLDIGIGYRFLTFTPVQYKNTTSTNGTSATLINGNSNNVYLDFSGPRVNMTVRLF